MDQNENKNYNFENDPGQTQPGSAGAENQQGTQDVYGQQGAQGAYGQPDVAANSGMTQPDGQPGANAYGQPGNGYGQESASTAESTKAISPLEMRMAALGTC